MQSFFRRVIFKWETSLIRRGEDLVWQVDTGPLAVVDVEEGLHRRQTHGRQDGHRHHVVRVQPHHQLPTGRLLDGQTCMDPSASMTGSVHSQVVQVLPFLYCSSNHETLRTYLGSRSDRTDLWAKVMGPSSFVARALGGDPVRRQAYEA